MGTAMREAKMLEVSDTVQSYTTVLENHVTSKTQMVLCVLSSEKKDLYDGIKQYLCVNCPTPKPVCRGTDLRQTPDADDHCDKDCPADELQDGRSPLEGGDRITECDVHWYRLFP